MSRTGFSPIYREPSGGGGGGSISLFKATVTAADFSAITNGFAANLLSLSGHVGDVILDITIGEVREAFDSYPAYFGVDITDWSEAIPDQAWLERLYGLYAIEAVDENALLTGTYDPRSAKDAFTPTNTADNYGYLPAAVKGGDWLMMVLEDMPTTGDCDVYMLIATPTAA